MPIPRLHATLLILGALLLAAQPGPALAVPKDVVLVLDNSGSMKKNDPEFLTGVAVREFLGKLGPDTHAGVIIFDSRVEMAVPLAPLTEESRPTFLRSLEQVDYRGQLTDIPAAIERAIYELRTNGRALAERSIVFMTDGIVDTGDEARDRDKHRWLREELAAEAADAGIRIFGIAFTENADFQLIQSLARRTDGGYFRAFSANDIAGMFERVIGVLEGPSLAAAPAPAPAAPSPEPELPPITDPDLADPDLPDPDLADPDLADPDLTAPEPGDLAAEPPADDLPPLEPDPLEAPAELPPLEPPAELPPLGPAADEPPAPPPDAATDALPPLPEEEAPATPDATPEPSAAAEPAAVETTPGAPPPEPAAAPAEGTAADPPAGEAASAPDQEESEPAPAAAGLPLPLLAAGSAAALLLVVAVVLVARARRRPEPDTAERAPKAYLNDLHGVTESPSYELSDRLTVIGRLEGTDPNVSYIVIDESTVGRQHAMVEYKEHSYRIVDQSSLNGTFLNGKKLEGEARLKHGDHVRFHKFEFEFVMLEMFETDRTMMSHTAFAGAADAAGEEDDVTQARPRDGAASGSES